MSSPMTNIYFYQILGMYPDIILINWVYKNISQEKGELKKNDINKMPWTNF